MPEVFLGCAVLSAVSALPCGRRRDACVMWLCFCGLCLTCHPYAPRPLAWGRRSSETISGGYCGGVPPLPIPNREVKPACADGTAMQCGRVGGRLLSYTPPLSFRDERQGRFFCARFFPFGVSEYRYAGISIYRYVVILE